MAFATVGVTVDTYRERLAEGQTPDWQAKDIADSQKAFLVDRLRYYLREVRGFAYDEVNAVLAAGR